MGLPKIKLHRSASENTGRDAVWAAMRELRKFSLPELVLRARVNRDVARAYLRALIISGHVIRNGATRTRARSQSRRANEFELARDIGVHAPPITRLGHTTQYGRGQEHLWRTIKVLREFSYVDLAISASTDEVRISRVAACAYLRHLRAAGYLVCTRLAHCGSKEHPASPARYRLIPQRWTGPLPPRVTARKQVYDPNRGCVVTPQSWSESK